MPDINTHHLVCDFGLHKGKPWTRVPVGYLLWMVNAKHHSAAIAEAELKRRGTVKPSMDITGHAIDRASQSLIGRWMASRLANEGLHAWLCRMATAAREAGKQKGDKFHYEGMKFVFEEGSEWPVLKTVMPDGKR